MVWLRRLRVPCGIPSSWFRLHRISKSTYVAGVPLPSQENPRCSAQVHQLRPQFEAARQAAHPTTHTCLSMRTTGGTSVPRVFAPYHRMRRRTMMPSRDSPPPQLSSHLLRPPPMQSLHEAGTPTPHTGSSTGQRGDSSCPRAATGLRRCSTHPRPPSSDPEQPTCPTRHSSRRPCSVSARTSRGASRAWPRRARTQQSTRSRRTT